MTKSTTRKQKDQSMSIPQLRKAFDHIESFTLSVVAKEKDPKQRRRAFQAEWMKVFHRSVDDKSADAYLQFEAKKHKKASKTRRMKGGAAITGAPLDYSTRPGIYGVYGTFPEYISNGFATFGDATNKMAIQEDCNSSITAKQFPPPYTGFGAASLVAQKGGRSRKHKKGSRKTKKLKGGAFPSISEFASAMNFRPVLSSVPPTDTYSAVMSFKGAPPYPSALANTGAPPYQPLKPMSVSTTVGMINRDLSAEV